MALDKDQLSKIGNLNAVSGNSRSRQLWHYYAVADTVAAAAAAGYFNDARGFLNVGDMIVVIGDTATDFGILSVTAAPAAGNVITAVVTGAEGGRIARGQAVTVAAVDTIVTGLAALKGVVAVLDDDPVAGAQFVTTSIGDQAGAPAAGSFLLKTWKSTAAADTAQIAATTFGRKVSWIAFEL